MEQGWEGCSCSDSIRHWLKENGKEINRENLTQGGRSLRSKGGPGILAELLLERISPEQPTIIDSIRTPDEVHALREREGFLLIEVHAPIDLRWERMQQRGREGDPENYQDFLSQEEAEAVAKNSSGQALVATAELADLLIINDGTRQELDESLKILLTTIESRL